MQTNTLKARLAKVAGVTALAAVGAATVLAGNNAAGADPKQLENALVGVGSDTTQDVLDALTGEVNGTLFTPVKTSGATNNTQLASFRATRDGVPCVAPRGGSASFDRPNGSGNGRRALSAALTSGAGWGRTDVSCTENYTATSGLVDFARSSSGSNDSSGPLTYVPFARDALQFLYYAPSGTPVTTLTEQEIVDLHNAPGAELNTGGQRIIACRIQDGSGTYESWAGNMGLDPDSGTDEAILEAATAECAAEFDATQQGIDGVQEHDPVGFRDVCDRVNATTPGTQCIIGYSTANFVAQFNGVGSRTLPITPAGEPGSVDAGNFNMGITTGLDGGAADQPSYNLGGSPVSASPNSTYYNGEWGRDVYNVIPTSQIEFPVNSRFKEMFLAGFDWDDKTEGNQGPAMCGAVAVATRSTLGFGAPFDNPCGHFGDTVLKRGSLDLSNTGPAGTPES